MATTQVNSITIVAAPPAASAKTPAAQSSFIDTLQVAVQHSDAPTARRTEDAPNTEREEQSEDDSTAVDSRQHSSDDDNKTHSAEASTDRDNEPESAETDSAETDDTEQTGTEDTLVVSAAAAEQVVVQEAVAEVLDVEAAKVEETASVPATEESGGQSSNPESQPSAPESAVGVEVTEEVAPLVTDEQAVGVEEQEVVDPVADNAPETSDQETSEAEVKPQSPEAGKAADAKEAVSSEQVESPHEEPAAPQSTADTAAKVAAPVDEKQTAATDNQSKRPSGGEKREKRSEVKPVDASSPPPQLELELDLEQEADPAAEVEAEVNQTEVREKPSQNTSNFNSILERATGPSTRRGNEVETTQAAGPRVDPQRFVARVSRAFQAAEQRGGTVQLRLAPPELGALRIELNMQNGTLNAKLETETAAAKNVLMDNLPALRDRLAAQEIRVDKFEVDVRDQNQGQPDWQAQQEQRDAQQHQGGRAVHSTTTTGTTTSSEEAAPADGGPSTNHDGQFSAVA
ncbi:flagellar hook-length control protein FliK [Aeoliella sp.]|uniref:flagellar hook-length control protein FliK n=1 Tax=Aeoliella sp. TaxID=2795800 RepID=UPI003CCC2A4A